jgi:hypothetical protein
VGLLASKPGHARGGVCWQEKGMGLVGELHHDAIGKRGNMQVHTVEQGARGSHGLDKRDRGGSQKQARGSVRMVACLCGG